MERGHPFYAFPDQVRRILYTTNAIEALNSKLRRAVRARGHFPNDEAAMKRLYLVLNRSKKEWKVGPRNSSCTNTQAARRSTFNPRAASSATKPRKVKF